MRERPMRERSMVVTDKDVDGDMFNSRKTFYHSIVKSNVLRFHVFLFTTPSHNPRQNLRAPTYSSPRLALTFPRHFLLKPFSSSLHILAASTFAGLSSFGLLSMLITLSSIVSGVCTGDQRSEADSYPYLSSSGG